MIINVDTVRGMNMESNNRNFDDIIEDYSATWFRAKIVDSENMYPLFTEWCKTDDSIRALKSLIDKILIDRINRSDATVCAVLQSMKVHITTGVEYGIIKDEED